MSRHVTTEPLDPRERYVLYRLCDCPTCEGRGQLEMDFDRKRCPDCRGEGRIRQEVASCETEEAVGVALLTLAREGEFEECQFGLLERGAGKNGAGHWWILPWPQTARTVSAAGSLLAKSKRA